MSTDETQVFRPSSLRNLGLLAGSAAFTAIGLWMVSEKDSSGWFVAGVFGLGVLTAAVLSLPNSSYLRLGPDGFTVCSMFRSHSYRWSDVATFEVGRIGVNRMIVFNFSPGYTGAKRGRLLATAMTGYEAALPDSYGMPLESLAALLNQYRQRHPGL
jgi:hypothetical protein